jgi:hypothetical protein
MVKVLIYSSKKLYDEAPFNGRAEAHVIAYRDGDFYHIIKNLTSQYMGDKVIHFKFAKIIEWAERDEWKRDMDSYNLKESYRNHPFTTLMSNEASNV